jgi:hypothetical protein
MSEETSLVTISGNELVIDFEKIYRYELRKDEVATVTKLGAPELMMALEKGYSECAKIYARLVAETTRAEEAMEVRQAEIQLDVVPVEEERRGKLSAAQREALVTTDTEYRRVRAMHDRLKATKEYVKGKMEGFQMSFSAVKRVYDSLSRYGIDAQQENLGISREEIKGGVGKPRY